MRNLPGRSGTPPPEKATGRRFPRAAAWTVGLVVVMIIALGLAAQLALDRAEPVLRSRVLETLETRFNCRAELDGFHVSVFRGFEVEGKGVRLFPRRFLTDQPLIAITRFSFRVSWPSFLHTPMHVGTVFVEGMAINIPPKDQRQALPPSPAPASATAPGHSTNHPGIKIVVDEVVIRNTRLLIGTAKPGKLPLDFEIGSVVLHSVGPDRPMQFDATLINPKPIGNIQSNGYFGPFQENSPGDTAVRGSYFFTHADLATFKGIGGTLASMGKYQGPLNHLTVDGEATVPDFYLSTGNHPMPLHTTFHAVVDGTSGDTYLQPVQAQLARSHFTVNGSVVKVRDAQGKQHGHDITLDVVMNDARIEDFLRLAVRTDPPVMDGALRMKARIFVPPGDVPVMSKLRLQGQFGVSGGVFSSEKIQQKVDLLSRLGEGHPKDPDLRVSAPQPEPSIPSELSGQFALADSRLNFPSLDFHVPGAQIDMAGVYTLDGSRFDFHGQAKLAAHPSQMTTGWKSLLLKMADPFFAKQGFGTVVPIQVSGTKAEPHFGLDFGYKPPPLDQPAHPR